MSNGARHGWGALAGLVLTAAVAALLIYGAERLVHVEGILPGSSSQDRYIAGAAFAGAAVLIGLLAGSRLSPVASLIGGVVLTAVGVLVFVAPGLGYDVAKDFPLKGERLEVTTLQGSGVFFVAGVTLLVSSMFPSRWHARAAASGPIAYDGDDGYGTDSQYGRHGRAVRQQQYAEDHPYYQPPPSYDGREPFSPPDYGTQPLQRRRD